VVAFEALHKARLAQARAVHLHPSQLSENVVHFIRKTGIDVHAWDVNDEQALQSIVKHDIPKICTDNFEVAAHFRNGIRVQHS